MNRKKWSADEMAEIIFGYVKAHIQRNMFLPRDKIFSNHGVIKMDYKNLRDYYFLPTGRIRKMFQNMCSCSSEENIEREKVLKSLHVSAVKGSFNTITKDMFIRAGDWPYIEILIDTNRTNGFGFGYSY